MSKFKFQLKEKSRINTLWLHLEYVSGDADASEYEDVKLDFPFSEYENYTDEITKIVNEYKTLKKITQDNDIEYEDVLEEWGEEMAEMWDCVPGDSTVDFQWKAHLGTIKLVGYDEIGNKYESYV